jgi:hypothetical protein
MNSHCCRLAPPCPSHSHRRCHLAPSRLLTLSSPPPPCSALPFTLSSPPPPRSAPPFAFLLLPPPHSALPFTLSSPLPPRSAPPFAFLLLPLPHSALSPHTLVTTAASLRPAYCDLVIAAWLRFICCTSHHHLRHTLPPRSISSITTTTSPLPCSAPPFTLSSLSLPHSTQSTALLHQARLEHVTWRLDVT